MQAGIGAAMRLMSEDRRLPVLLMCECVQARQQSVEEVNQRWAAKSHTLLSRIANLEQQLQGQGQGQSGTSPTPEGQVRHHGPVCVLVSAWIL